MSVDSSLEDFKNAILDLQQADYNTYARPIKKMAAALTDPDLQSINDKLKEKVDFESFTDRKNNHGMAGSAQLDWPADKELELGLTLQIIENAGNDPKWLLNFSHYWFYDGNKIVAGLHKFTRSILIPFARDYKSFLSIKAPIVVLENKAPIVALEIKAPIVALEKRAVDKTKVFIVHGHDEGPRDAVARFLEKMGLTPIILHEQASQGMTIPEKLTAHGDVGFAVVLLTPDDLGRAKIAAEDRPRARQNVILELGYFVGRLGWDKVCVLLKGGIEIPSDYAGIVYINLETASTWKLELAKELSAAGYDIDLNKI